MLTEQQSMRGKCYLTLLFNPDLNGRINELNAIAEVGTNLWALLKKDFFNKV